MTINVQLTLLVIAFYFMLLLIIAYFTNKKSTHQSFFNGDKSSPWYLVAFGMIGASLSGVTFISVPGMVLTKNFSYLITVFGFFIGYVIIAFVLLPIYYQLKLTTIYTYLKQRFGNYAYKTAAFFFLLSKLMGASIRLYLVAEVMDLLLFEAIGLPYWLGIVCTILLIWIYTFKGGIKTIVWTDTLQTACMLSTVIIAIFYIKEAMGLSLLQSIDSVYQSEWSALTKVGNENIGYYVLNLINGAFIAIVMTGLDQDMMQKNLTCKNLKDAQKNILSYSLILIPVNMLFLGLGVLLYQFVNTHDLLEVVYDQGNIIGLNLQSADLSSVSRIKSDLLFPSLATQGYFPAILGVLFLVGLIAAAYSSADSALTSLTTSFCIDIIEEEKSLKTRRMVHVGMSVLMVLTVLFFKLINDDSVIEAVFLWAGFTYGPLLGIFTFAIITKKTTQDKLIPWIAIFSAVSTYLIQQNSMYLFNYSMGFENLLLNGLLTFSLLTLFSRKSIT